MKTYKHLYEKICDSHNLILAFKKARKGKTKKFYVIKFQRDFINNINRLQDELKNQTYWPQLLKTFILRDPKTRKISKSAFRDRIIHHAIANIIEPIIDKTFIYDSCANRVGKGNLFALKRFDLFKRRVTNNLRTEAYCLKADIKHYFQEVDHNILLSIIKRKIKDDKVIWLIKRILKNGETYKNGGMPNVIKLSLNFFLCNNNINPFPQILSRNICFSRGSDRSNYSF